MIEYFKAKAHQFWQRICWSAWTYARKREIARRGSDFGIAPIPESHADQTPGHRRVLGNEARQLLDNKHFRETFMAVEEALEAQAQACNPDRPEQTQRVVIAKQILASLKREIVRKAEDGYMAEVELDEMARRRKPLRFQR